MGINPFDIIVFVILMAFMLLSYWRGALREFIALTGILGGFWAGLRYHQELAEYLNPIVQDGQLSEILTFVMVMVAGYLAGAFLSGLVSMGQRGTLNNVLGGAIGLLKGLAVTLALYWIVDEYLPPFKEEVVNSRSAPLLKQLLGAMQAMLH